MVQDHFQSLSGSLGNTTSNWITVLVSLTLDKHVVLLERQSAGKKPKCSPTTCPFALKKIPHCLCRDWTQASTATSQRLTSQFRICNHSADKEINHFFVTNKFILCSQKSAIGTYPGPVKIQPIHHNIISSDTLKIMMIITASHR
jgi:hypothetical protein